MEFPRWETMWRYWIETTLWMVGSVSTFVFRPLVLAWERVEPLVNAFWRFVERNVWRVAVAIVVALGLAAATFVVALCIYMMAYWIMVPMISAEADLHFVYPSANAPKHYPNASASLHGLTRGQSYRIGVTLVVPDSEVNQNVGMFMVHITLLTRNGSHILHTQRPLMLPYRSTLAHWIHMLWWNPFYAFGWMTESHDLELVVMEDYVEKRTQRLHSVIVTLSDPRVQLYRSKLHCDANLSGIAWLWSSWFWLVTVVAVSYLWFWLYVFALLAVLFSFCFASEREDAPAAERRRSWGRGAVAPAGRERHAGRAEPDGDGTAPAWYRSEWSERSSETASRGGGSGEVSHVQSEAEAGSAVKGKPGGGSGSDDGGDVGVEQDPLFKGKHDIGLDDDARSDVDDEEDGVE